MYFFNIAKSCVRKKVDLSTYLLTLLNMRDPLREVNALNLARVAAAMFSKVCSNGLVHCVYVDCVQER